MFSAQTRTRSPRDTLDRIQRAAPHADHDTPKIEGRLKFDFLTEWHVVRDAVANNFVDTGTDGLGEAVVVERRGVGASFYGRLVCYFI